MKFIQIVAVVLVVGVIEASSGNIFIENAQTQGVGAYGGSCTCPDGIVYQVGDNNNYCGSLACINGTPGHCNQESGPWSYGKVECSTAENTIEISSSGTDIEFTVVVIGDDNPQLSVPQGDFPGSWATMVEGALQFSDRNYVMTKVPNYLIGARYYKGPCHSRGATVTVDTTGTTYVLASKGNGGHVNKFEFSPEPSSYSIIETKTTSFPSNNGFTEYLFNVETTLEPTFEPTAEPTHEICPVNYHSSIVENFPNTADQCNCGSDTNQVCAKNQFCYGTKCHLNAHTCSAGAHKDIFYGGKVTGSWLKENNKIEMSIKTPYDVKIKSIVWQTSSFQNIDDRTLKYDVSDSSLATKWALTSGTQTEPCKTIYTLSVPTKTYFGAGSQFTLKHVAKKLDIAERYELRSSVKVTAEQEMSYLSSKGITYTYTRDVVNNLPIFVKLQTKSTITVTFKMISGTPLLTDNFVLFVGGEEGMEGSKHMVTIEMISFSAHGLADVTSGGIIISQEAARIKTGSNSFSYTSETDTENFDREGNLVKDYITWKFEPQEVYKETTYDITLKFKDKNSDETWEAIAAIHIEAEDLMTEVGFETDVSLYSDQQCLHSATTFIRGAGVFAKVVLSEEIVEIESIACSKFIVKQYSNPKTDGADALVEKHMIIEQDRFSFTQTKLQNNTQDIKNTLVCGAELDSADFYVSKAGYPTELLIEVTVTYKKDKTTIRRILSVPMASNWALKNPHTFSEQAIGEAQSFAPLNDYGMENNDEVAVGSSVQQENSNESEKKLGSEQMTTNFLMIKDNGLGYASETAIATENDANSEATNMGTRITFGAVFLCTAGISIYLRKIWVKSSEYTPLLD